MQVVDKFVYNFKIEYVSYYRINKYWYRHTEYCYMEDKDMKLITKYKINTDDILCFTHNLCKTLNGDIDYLCKHTYKCKFYYCVNNKYMLHNNNNAGFNKIIKKTITSNQYENIYHINMIIEYKTLKNELPYSHNTYKFILLVNNMKDEHIRKEYLMNCEKNNFHNILLGFENGYDPVRFKTLINYLR